MTETRKWVVVAFSGLRNEKIDSEHASFLAACARSDELESDGIPNDIMKRIQNDELTTEY